MGDSAAAGRRGTHSDDDYGEEALPDALRADRRAFHRCGIYEAADWYDVDYAAYRGEFAFYRSVLERYRGDGVAVELGAGTGRLTLPLAALGHRMHAVEPATAMRALLLRKIEPASHAALSIEDARASTFAGPPGGTDVTVVCFAFNGLLHVAGRAELDASFRRVHKRLAAGGRFAFDVTSPYWETMQRGSVPWGRVDERIHPRTGRRFLTCDRSTYDATTRTTHIDIRYAFVDGDEPGVQTSLQQFMWTFPELRAAAVRCGFVVEEAWGDVDLAPADDGAPRLLLLARRG